MSFFRRIEKVSLFNQKEYDFISEDRCEEEFVKNFDKHDFNVELIVESIKFDVNSISYIDTYESESWMDRARKLLKD